MYMKEWIYSVSSIQNQTRTHAAKRSDKSRGDFMSDFGEKEARIALKGVRIDLEHEACVLEDFIWLDDFHMQQISLFLEFT